MLPVLYSFRRCPYAMRARLAIKYAGLQVELREVLLADKPAEMLHCSPKGTVPVLQLDNGEVIDESMEIIYWALANNDPQHWLGAGRQMNEQCRELIDINDGPFKQQLDHYKYADRYPEQPAEYYRRLGEPFLARLDEQLKHNRYLLDNSLSLADVALFPFIRQFAFVDINWFDQSDYKNLQYWLRGLLEWSLFSEIMKKCPRWKAGNRIVVL